MTTKAGHDEGAAEERRRAVSLLQTSADPALVDQLIAALSDPDWRVRKEAVEVGERIATRLPIVAQLVEVIAHTDDVGHRNSALELIGRIGQSSVKAIVEALDQVPPNSRKFVIGALGEAGRPEDVAVLEELLADADPNVIAASLEAISRLGGPGAERILSARLHSEDAFHRVAALDGLDRQRAKVPFEALAPLATDRLTRKMAIQVMGRSGDARALPLLGTALGDANPQIAAAAVLALGRLGDVSDENAEKLRVLAEALPDSDRARVEGIALHGDPSVRPYAVRLLVLGRDARVFAALVELAANDALGVKELVALRAWGERAAEALLEQWKGSQGRARAAALELAAYVALGEPGRSRVSPALDGKVRAALREDITANDPEVRLGAARAMLDWAEASDAHGLTEVAKRGPEEVSRAAGQALEALADRHQSAVRLSLAPVRLNGPGGAALTSVVARLAEDNVIDRLRDALSADDPVTRRSAVEALGTVGGADAADAIGIALADEDADVQATAARVLGGLRGKAGAPVGVDRLLGAAAATNASVRAAVARALGDTRDARVFGALAALLDDEDPAVLIATMEGLRAYGDSAAGALVGRFLSSDDQEMVKQALWCVAELDPAAARGALITALDHIAWDVRQLAAMLLGESRDPGAIVALTQRLATEDYDLVREAILSALAVVQGNG